MTIKIYTKKCEVVKPDPKIFLYALGSEGVKIIERFWGNNSGGIIGGNNRDRHLFLKGSVKVIGYCLMNTHLHLLLRECEEIGRSIIEKAVKIWQTKRPLVFSINKNESNKDNALEALKIFEEIEVEEKEKISELFGEETSISKYFNEITDGFYKEVTFNQETGRIKVKRMDGEILGAEKLSGGAHDQLYFSIRLALGEKLLKGNKGFFILDDPFVKADPDRLKRQIDTLKNITKLGWQVLYFSAKGEIHDALKMDIENGTVNYIKFQGLFSGKNLINSQKYGEEGN